ncbi:hypothetical protein GGP41_000412 [Bipolaris sorokiniana]|nr:hypothetical protein GGP41_000412 [Bipolaris sorokiniana]
MVGHNANEGALFTPFTLSSTAALEDLLRGLFENIPQSSIDYILDGLYPPVLDGSKGYTNNVQHGSPIIAESGFTYNTCHLSKAYGNNTYSYLFAVPPAIHTQDVAYTYYDGGATSGDPMGITNTIIAITLKEFTTSFAEMSIPVATSVEHFKTYSVDANVLELNVNGIKEVRDNNANAQCDL